MNRHNQEHKLTPKALIYRIVITITALFIVCLYMPRDERNTYLSSTWANLGVTAS